MNHALTIIGTICLWTFGTVTAPEADEATRYAGDPLLLGAGARALGMGSAFVAVSDDATAVYWNPAGLAQLQRKEVQLQHAERFGGTVNHDAITFAAPHEAGTFGVGLLRLGVDGISITELENPDLPPGPDNRPVVSATDDATDYTVFLSYGRRVHRHATVGASLKLLRRDLAAGDGSGYGLDVAALYKPWEGWAVGLTIRNLTGTSISFDSGSTDRISPSALFGLAYTRALVSTNGRLTASASLHLGEERSGAEDVEGVHIGTEYSYKEFVSLRVGAEGDHFTAGAGLRIDGRFGLDLAFLENGQLDNTYRISASVYF